VLKLIESLHCKNLTLVIDRRSTKTEKFASSSKRKNLPIRKWKVTRKGGGESSRLCAMIHSGWEARGEGDKLAWGLHKKENIDSQGGQQEKERLTRHVWSFFGERKQVQFWRGENNTDANLIGSSSRAELRKKDHQAVARDVLLAIAGSIPPWEVTLTRGEISHTG